MRMVQLKSCGKFIKSESYFLQVKIWFQNRRMKMKKIKLAKNSDGSKQESGLNQDDEEEDEDDDIDVGSSAGLSPNLKQEIKYELKF